MLNYDDFYSSMNLVKEPALRIIRRRPASLETSPTPNEHQMRGIFEFKAGEIPNVLKGYPRVEAMIEISQMGLPCPKGIVVTSWDKSTAHSARSYFERMGWHEVLIRSDAKREKDFSIRGGFLFSLDAAMEEIKRLIKKDRVAILLEPMNKYTNLYGINTFINIPEKVVQLEVVGPGFDITDLNRGDLSPHENISLDVRDDQITSHILQHSIINDAAYKESVRQRFEKIEKDICRMKKRNQLRKGMIDVGEFLRKQGKGTVLDTRHKYSPLSKRLLRTYVNYIKDLFWILPSRNKEKEYVVSSSIIGSYHEPKYVFWDYDYFGRKYKF